MKSTTENFWVWKILLWHFKNRQLCPPPLWSNPQLGECPEYDHYPMSPVPGITACGTEGPSIATSPLVLLVLEPFRLVGQARFVRGDPLGFHEHCLEKHAPHPILLRMMEVAKMTGLLGVNKYMGFVDNADAIAFLSAGYVYSRGNLVQLLTLQLRWQAQVQRN